MQRQAMGVALHIVLLPFFELLHSTIDSYDADLIVGFFCLPFPSDYPKRVNKKLEEEMSMLLALQFMNTRQSDPVPTDPTPMPDPIPRPQPMPDPPPDEEPIKMSHPTLISARIRAI